MANQSTACLLDMIEQAQQTVRKTDIAARRAYSYDGTIGPLLQTITGAKDALDAAAQIVVADPPKTERGEADIWSLGAHIDADTQDLLALLMEGKAPACATEELHRCLSLLWDAHRSIERAQGMITAERTRERIENKWSRQGQN